MLQGKVSSFPYDNFRRIIDRQKPFNRFQDGNFSNKKVDLYFNESSFRLNNAPRNQHRISLHVSSSTSRFFFSLFPQLSVPSCSKTDEGGAGKTRKRKKKKKEQREKYFFHVYSILYHTHPPDGMITEEKKLRPFRGRHGRDGNGAQNKAKRRGNQLEEGTRDEMRAKENRASPKYSTEDKIKARVCTVEMREEEKKTKKCSRWGIVQWRTETTGGEEMRELGAYEAKQGRMKKHGERHYRASSTHSTGSLAGVQDIEVEKIQGVPPNLHQNAMWTVESSKFSYDIGRA